MVQDFHELAWNMSGPRICKWGCPFPVFQVFWWTNYNYDLTELCWWLFLKLQMLQVQSLFQAVWLSMVALTLPSVSIKWIPWNLSQAYSLWWSHLTRFGWSPKELDTIFIFKMASMRHSPQKQLGAPHDHIISEREMDSAVPYSMPQHLWCPGWWCSIPCSCRCGSSHFHCGLVQCTFEGALVTEKRRLDGPWWLLGEATWWICWIPMFQQFANDRNIQADMGGSNICNLLNFKQNIRWLLPNLLMIQHNRFATLPFHLNRPAGFQTLNVRFCFTPTVISHI